MDRLFGHSCVDPTVTPYVGGMDIKTIHATCNETIFHHHAKKKLQALEVHRVGFNLVLIISNVSDHS